jgi:hypothetical protein
MALPRDGVKSFVVFMVFSFEVETLSNSKFDEAAEQEQPFDDE